MNRFVCEGMKNRLYFIKFKPSSASSAFWFLALYRKDKARNLISRKKNSASSASSAGSALWTWPLWRFSFNEAGPTFPTLSNFHVWQDEFRYLRTAFFDENGGSWELCLARKFLAYLPCAFSGKWRKLEEFLQNWRPCRIMIPWKTSKSQRLLICTNSLYSCSLYLLIHFK